MHKTVSKVLSDNTGTCHAPLSLSQGKVVDCPRQGMTCLVVCHSGWKCVRQLSWCAVKVSDTFGVHSWHLWGVKNSDAQTCLALLACSVAGNPTGAISPVISNGSQKQKTKMLNWFYPHIITRVVKLCASANSAHLCYQLFDLVYYHHCIPKWFLPATPLISSDMIPMQ